MALFVPQRCRFLPSLFRKSFILGTHKQCSVGLATEETPTRVEKTLNNVTLMGRVGAEPQLRGSDQHPVVTFSLATHTNYKYENGDWAQRTDWHRIVVFKPNLRTTVMDYLKKGQRTLVQGRITYGEITDMSGNQKVSCSIVADDVVFFKES